MSEAGDDGAMAMLGQNGDRRRRLMGPEHWIQALVLLAMIGIPVVTFGGLLFGRYSSLAATSEEYGRRLTNVENFELQVTDKLLEATKQMATVSAQVGAMLRDQDNEIRRRR